MNGKNKCVIQPRLRIASANNIAPSFRRVYRMYDSSSDDGTF